MARDEVTIEFLALMLGDVLAAVNDGRSAREACFLRLARLVGANAFAHVLLNTSKRQGKVTCWPGADERARSDFTTDEAATARDASTLGAERSPEALWRSSTAFSELRARLHYPELEGVPLAYSPHELRLAVFGAAGQFDPEQAALIKAIRLPLMRLDAQLSLLEDRRPPSRIRAPHAPASFREARLLAAHHGLTPREFEVLRLLSLGLSARSIGARLAVSPRTVNKHLGKIYQKLGSHDRLLAVRRASDLGLLPVATLEPREQEPDASVPH